MKEKKLKEIRYPENRRVAGVLQRGDRKLIALATNYNVLSIRDMLQGYRRMPDTVKAAIVDLMNRRSELNQTLEQICETA